MAAWGPISILIDRNHLSFFPPNQTRQKITIEKFILAKRFASETSLS